ncbi:hypothetical protein WJX73_005009 [Symbiochloris irregularis]|uniref:Senescence domain-containing protein n=1 Tax=Symbiochloris irregularis TaxID=706552 RepID=A0AAW1PMK5_9CHLO
MEVTQVSGLPPLHSKSRPGEAPEQCSSPAQDTAAARLLLASALVLALSQAQHAPGKAPDMQNCPTELYERHAEQMQRGHVEEKLRMQASIAALKQNLANYKSHYIAEINRCNNTIERLELANLQELEKTRYVMEAATCLQYIEDIFKVKDRGMSPVQLGRLYARLNKDASPFAKMVHEILGERIKKCGASPKGDLLCKLPEVQVHKVEKGKDQLVAQAPLTVSVESAGSESQVVLQVDRIKFVLDLSLPTLKSSSNAFMFAMPDNTFYCVLLPYGLPEEDVALWEVLLEETTAFQHQGGLGKAGKEELVDEVSEELMQPGAMDDDAAEEAADAPSPTIRRITSGSAKMQMKIAEAGDWASKKLMDASEKMKEKYPPNEQPMKVSPSTLRNLQRARTVANHGATGAAKVATVLTDLSANMADKIIRTLGRTKYSEDLGNPNASPQKKRSAIRDVAAASVLAALEVYEGMETAALSVTKASGDASHNFVSHRWGDEAGQATKHVAATTYSAASTVRSVAQIRQLGAKRIAKRVARRTAKGIATSWVRPVEVGPNSSNTPASQQQQQQRLQNSQSQKQSQAQLGQAQTAKPAKA